MTKRLWTPLPTPKTGPESDIICLVLCCESKQNVDGVIAQEDRLARLTHMLEDLPGLLGAMPSAHVTDF